MNISPRSTKCSCHPPPDITFSGEGECATSGDIEWGDHPADIARRKSGAVSPRVARAAVRRRCPRSTVGCRRQSPLPQRL